MEKKTNLSALISEFSLCADRRSRLLAFIHNQ